MKEISLTQGKVALVDDEDYTRVARYHWCFSHGYAKRRATLALRMSLMIYMHRLLMGAIQGQEVDHINMNTLDNRRENLRLCTSSQNKGNAKRRTDNTSGFRGVSFYRRDGNWTAQLVVRGQYLYLGRHATATEAARAYDKAARKHFGEFARLNFPMGD